MGGKCGRRKKWFGWNGALGKRLVCGENCRAYTGAGSEIGLIVFTWNEIWFAEGFVRKFTSGGANAYRSGKWSALVDFGGGGTKNLWKSVAICWYVWSNRFYFVFYVYGGVDAVDFEGGSDGDFDSYHVVRGTEDCAS